MVSGQKVWLWMGFACSLGRMGCFGFIFGTDDSREPDSDFGALSCAIFYRLHGIFKRHSGIHLLEERGKEVKPRISMITLGVADLQISVEFYENGLKFPKMETSPDIAMFNLNGTWLSLYKRESLAEDASVSPKGNGFPGFTLSHNLKSEVEVDQAIKDIIEVGGVLVKAPEKAFWGGYSGYFKDPDGYLWEIAYNPLFWVGPEDE